VRPPTGIAVIVVTLDRYKRINDGLGNAAGDAVLALVAERLAGTIREQDTLACLGSDEFGILAEGFATEDALVGYAIRLRDAIRRELVLGNATSMTSVTLDASIGIAFSPADDTEERSMLQEADAAMNVVKARGRGGVELSLGGLSEIARQRLGLEQELRQAIDRGELCVHYQPQVDHRLGRVVGVEALVRWNHPERGLVGPGDFIPVAEETDLIVDIGRFVLETGCRQLAAWRAEGVDLTLSVNLAARQLVVPSFCHDIDAILTECGLDPDALTLEVTESVLFRDTAAVAAVIDCLRRIGVHLALDDFGTGYSSLVYLRRFHVGEIKIDRSFVSGIGHEPEDETIIRSIINLARSLGIGLVAEGAETEAEADWLVRAGCDVIQGYVDSRPLPATDVLPWIAGLTVTA
jgi:diguanylate cyclase (GGDEF)-like protein